MRASQEHYLFSGQLLHLLEDDLFQLRPLRLWAGYDHQIIQVLIHLHLLGAGQDSRIVDPLVCGIQVGAAQLAGEIVAVWGDVRHYHAIVLDVEEAVDGMVSISKG